MRASRLGLVIATACPLLRVVKAQDSEPTIIGIGSSALTADTPYTVTLEGCAGTCRVTGVALLEIQQLVTTTTIITAHSLSSVACAGSNIDGTGVGHECFQGIAPSQLTATYIYRIEAGFQSAGATTTALSTTGSPLAIDTLLPGTSTGSSTLPSSTTLLSSSVATGPAPGSVKSLPVTATLSSTATTAASAPASPPVATSTVPVSSNTSESSGLSTGAKVGIAIGAVGSALLILIAALLLWRRSRQRQLRAFPNGEPYSHDTGSTNRDFTAEKEMHVINSPVDTLHGGYSSIPPVAETQNRSPRGSYPQPDDHATADSAPYSDAHHGSYGSGYENSASPTQDSQAHIQPAAAAAAGAAIQRKPVGVASGPTHHLREPGMSDEEVARLEEEERRIDEAIAEAERRRQQQG